jgi:hypothetical protein
MMHLNFFALFVRSRKSKHSGDNSKDDTASVRSGGSKRSKRGKDSHRDEEKEDEPEGVLLYISRVLHYADVRISMISISIDTCVYS